MQYFKTNIHSIQRSYFALPEVCAAARGSPLIDELVRRDFNTFIHKQGYNSDQMRFLQTVQGVFLQRWKLMVDERPFTAFGTRG